jgi:23S rRNA (adenine2503-C2)-methyltransferase
MIDPHIIDSVVADLGARPYRARQVYEALTHALITDFADMTALPLALRHQLAERLSPLSLRATESQVTSNQAARKTLFETADGHTVEAVLMTYPTRATVCVSTQVGCAVGCAFCASGRTGLQRGLTAEEMVDQVFHFARSLRDEGRQVTNVVFMGMGEPFHNYDETLRACRLLNDQAGFCLAARAISVSTVGVVPGIDRFTDEPLQLNLAVSLHAGTDELRSRLVPLNRTYGLDDIFGACARYVRRTHRQVMFEYVVLQGVNDTPEQVQALMARVRPPHYHLNLIAFNETGDEFVRPLARDLGALCTQLQKAGLICTVRRSPGRDIDAACGQLAQRHGSQPVPPIYPSPSEASSNERASLSPLER